MPNTSQLIFGKSDGVRRALALCENYARLRYPLLILGPTGTGKTVLARHIHRLSGRGGAFVKLRVLVYICGVGMFLGAVLWDPPADADT